MNIIKLAQNRTLLAILTVILGISGVFAMDSKSILVFDRLDSDWIITKKFRVNYGLNASGSGQFSAKELEQILAAIPTKSTHTWIVDLRQESHGFINGLPVSWTGDKNAVNSGKKAEQILHTENNLLAQIRKQPVIEVFELKKLNNGAAVGEKPVNIQNHSVQSEEQLAQSLKAKYKRLYVLDHNKPDDQTVDDFINFIKYDVKPGEWLHFHCRGGKGRSSSFIVMYDMIINGHNTSFDEIIKRQAEMGNISLNSMPNDAKKLWKLDASSERYNFLKKFYTYVKDSNGYPHQSWSTWLSKQPTP